MKVLVQFNPRHSRAYGLWWVGPDGNLRSLYTDEQSPQAARGRLIVFGKQNPDVSWSDYFDILATRVPYVESWGVYDSMGMTPQQMLSALDDTSPLAS